MVAEELNSVPESVQVSCNEVDDQNLQLSDVDEAEETLSLCDLAVNNNNTTEDCSWNDQQSSSSDQDFFEFFSEDFTASSSTISTDSIIFCGKLIPQKQNAVPEQSQKIKNNTILKQQKKKHIFALKPTTKRTTSSNAKHQEKKTTNNYKPLSSSFPYDYKVSTKALTSNYSTKSRWYLFAFGYAKLPTEMELRDIKNRQSRRKNINTATTMFKIDDNNGGGGDQMINKRKNKKESSPGKKSLWRLLKVLGCKSRRANSVVKASFGLRSTCLSAAGRVGQD